MTTTAGQLNERIAFDSREPIDPAEPDSGNTEGDFAERFVLWARAQFLRGTEAVMASRLEGRQPVVFTVRASSLSRQITTEWRARDTRTGIAYAIRSVTATEDRAFMDILAESGIAA